MIRDRRRRRLIVGVLAFVALGLTACSHPTDTSGETVPTADVLTGVRTDAALHTKLPSSIRASGELVFGTTLQPGTADLPYSGTADGKNVGLHVDLENAVSKVLGLEPRAENGTFPTIVPGVQNGKFDVGLANLGVTAEREKVVDFATYLTDGQAFLGSKDVTITKVRTLADLCGLTIATSPGSTFQQILNAGAQNCAEAGRKPYEVQYFGTDAPILLGLSNGRVDAEFGPTLSMKYDAAHIRGTKFLGQLSSTPVGFITAKGSPLAPILRDAVNELIAGGTYRRILAKWGITASGIRTSEFNPRPTL